MSLYPSAPPALSLSISHDEKNVTNGNVQVSEGDSVTLDCAATGGSGTYSYEWTKGDVTSALATAGDYKVTDGVLNIDNADTSQ